MEPCNLKRFGQKNPESNEGSLVVQMLNTKPSQIIEILKRAEKKK